MMKKIGILVAMAVLMIAAFSIPSLAATANPGEQQMLQARYDSVSARVGFTAGVMTDIISLVPQASDLNTHIDRLNADLAALSSYVSAGDASGFSGFVSGTINPDLKAADVALVADRTHYREWNVTLQTRQELRTKYDARKATFDAQIQAVTVELGSIRLSNYNDAVAKANAQIDRLSAKGVDVSGMQTAVTNGQASVIQPLQAAVNSGNADSVKAELKGKALGNGAPYSYHFWAKKDIASTSAISAKIADNATLAGYGDQLAAVNAEIAAAQSALDTVGTNPYTAAQKDSVWDNLKMAAEGLKNIIKELGGH